MGCCNSKEAQSPELAPDNSDLGYGITGSGKNGVKNDGMEYGRDGQISPQSMNNYEKQDSQATFHGINQQLSNPYNNYAQYGDEHFHGELQHQGQGQRQRAGSTPEHPRNYMEPTASGRARSNSSSQDPFRRVPSNGMPGSMSDPRLMPPRSANSTPDIGTDKLVPQHLVKPRGTSRVFTQSMIGSDFKISRPLSPQVGTPQSSPFHSSSPPNFHDNFGQSPPNSANSAYHPQPLGYPPQSSNQPRQQPQMRTIAQHETSRSPSPQPHQTTNPTNLTHQATNQSSQQGLPQRQTTIQGHTIMVKKEPSLKAQPAKGLLRVKGAGPSPLSSSNSPQQPIRSSTADSGDTEDDDDYLPRAGSVMHTQVNVEVRQAQIRQEPIEEDLSLPRAGSVVRSNVNVEVQQIQSTKGAALSQDLAQQQPKATSAPSQAAPQEKVVATAPSQITLQPSLVDDEEAEGEEGEDIDYGDDIFNKYRLSVASTFVPSLARPGKNNRLSIVPPKPAPDFAAARMAPEEKSFALSENTVASNTAATYPDFYSEDEDEDEDENEDEEEVEIEDDEVVVEEEDYFDFDGYIDQGEVAEADPNAPVCAFCEEAIVDEKPIHILGRYWHIHHSRCKECRRPIGVDNFAEIEGFLYCEDHYYEVRGEYRIRKSNPKKKRASYIENELAQIQTLSTVRKVRNLLNFEKSVRLNIVTLEDTNDADGDDDHHEHRRPRRFVTSFIAPPGVNLSEGGTSGLLKSLDPAVAAQLTGRRAMPKGPQPLGGTGRHASVLGAARPVKQKKKASKSKMGSGGPASLLSKSLTVESPTGSFPSPALPDTKEKSMKDRRVTVLI